MALHRDIYWVGKQWTVTGSGLQLIDQKRTGEFDVDLLRLWEDGLLESMRAKAWVNSDDFARGLSIARARYPRPPGNEVSPEVKAPTSEAGPPAKTVKSVQPEKPRIEFHMRIRGVRAKFLKPWRIRTRK
jgi:hypothetical protein